jgi:hypothetical protein
MVSFLWADLVLNSIKLKTTLVTRKTYLLICFRIGTGVARGEGGPLCRMGEGAGRGKDLGGGLGAGAACTGAS